MAIGTGLARRVTGVVLTALLALLLTFSASMKLLGASAATETMAAWGLADWRIVIGIGELVSTALFVIPGTAPLGTLLLSSYLGGAIVTHMQHGEPFIPPAVFLVIVWTTAALRLPGWLSRPKNI
jgi:hypothetical protein